MKRLIIPLVLAGIFMALMFGVAQAGADAGGAPAPQANCIGAANSGGAQGAFESGLATTLPPGELGADTSAILGGPHGLIGVVASSNDCG